MWNSVNRSAPGTSASAKASGLDSNSNGSVSSERKNSAPSRCRGSSAEDTASFITTVSGSRLTTQVSWSWVISRSPNTIEVAPRHLPRSRPMTEFPPLTHVALTGRDLDVSVPWYEALLDTRPGIDEDPHPDMHPTASLLGNRTLLGLHQHLRPAPAGSFSEFPVGLDHIAFGC